MLDYQRYGISISQYNDEGFVEKCKQFLICMYCLRTDDQKTAVFGVLTLEWGRCTYCFCKTPEEPYNLRIGCDAPHYSIE